MILSVYIPPKKLDIFWVGIPRDPRLILIPQIFNYCVSSIFFWENQRRIRDEFRWQPNENDEIGAVVAKYGFGLDISFFCFSYWPPLQGPPAETQGGGGREKITLKSAGKWNGPRRPSR